LQDRLRLVQQKLNDAANATHTSKNRLTEYELTSLRTEFCALLRELKQRCSLGLTPNQPDVSRSDTSDSRPITDHVHVAASSQEGSLIVDTETRSKRLDHVRKCSAERILPTVVKTRTVDSDNVNTSTVTLGGGDFDEQKLNDAANATHTSKNRLTEYELTSLRTEFCALLRELKQRCSLGLTPNQPDVSRSDTSDSRPITDHVHVAASSQEGSLIVDTETRSKRLDHVRKCSAERILPTVVKTRTVDSDNVNTSTVTLGGGDFDEDPDFYIDDCDEEEDEFDDGVLMVETPSPRANATEARRSPLPSSTIMTPTDLQPSDKITSMLMLPQRSDRWPREMKIATTSDHRPRRKRRRTSVNSSGHRRSSSLLPANLTSLDLTPNRRGSLGASSGVPGAESLLVKLVKPKTHICSF
ncbi:hypothetical protein AHF37_10115, partial [Paragonimus kellicotti]